LNAIDFFDILLSRPDILNLIQTKLLELLPLPVLLHLAESMLDLLINSMLLQLLEFIFAIDTLATTREPQNICGVEIKIFNFIDFSYLTDLRVVP